MNAESKMKADAPVVTPGSAEAGAGPGDGAPAVPRRRGLRRRHVLMLALPVALVAGGTVAYLAGGGAVSTQDAYLHQAKVAISSNVAGRVVSIGFTDNQPVAKGALLFQVDPKPYQLALEQADAALAQARLQVAQLKTAYAAAQTAQKVAGDQVKYYDTQLARQKTLAARGAASIQALDNARNADVVARGQLETARQKVSGALAALGGDAAAPVDSHPAVQAALAARARAAFELAQTKVEAPAGGIVYKAGSFRPGQFANPGAAVFTLVEPQHSWVDANFKETQLGYVRPGQSARVVFDLYPGKVFNGRVAAIGAGTGAEFSLLPAQNATGNWVKVTQRIPVRIVLDNPPADLSLHSGISANVTVETGHARHLSDLLPFGL